MKEIESDPETIGLSFKEVNFKAADNIELNGWFIPCEGAEDSIIFCHGNGGNISHRLEKIAILHIMGLNVFIFDYRGYGRSKGSPSEKGLYKDAEAAYGYLISRDNISAENIILYGESIGGAVAIDLARRRKIKALITEETFSSVKDMTRIIYPFLPYFALRSRFDSVSKIKGINVPKLIIHSIDDEIVPFHLGEKLFESASSPKEFLKIRGSHNTAFLDSKELFISGITSFVNAL
jgi:fermentation-respiration switch protein FrsA (DUF1100 family)